ncbi:ATP-binding cassette domain-containing protein [Pseudaeromonas paramecii]|uniref:ABC transporter transmembrane domain-containing protein n=1 Tax=Pseudaeromonas paramecii TaxID=2138166 RepID=A0ABP8PRZ2_9GAMM
MKMTLRRLLAYALPHWRPLMRALGLLLLATLAEVAGPLLIQYFVDDYLLKPPLLLIPALQLGALYVGLQLLCAWAGYRQALGFNQVAQTLVAQVRQSLFAATLRLPSSWLDHSRTGQLISTLTNDTEALKTLYLQIIGRTLQKGLLLLGILAAMAWLDLRLALLAGGLLLGTLVIMVGYQRWSLPLVRTSRQLLAEINGQLNESLQGMAVVRAFNRGRHALASLDGLNERQRQARMQELRLNGLLLRPLIELLKLLVIVGLLAAFASPGPHPLQVGLIYAFLSYLGRMIEPLNELANMVGQLQQALVAGERVFALLDAPQERQNGRDCQLQGAVRFEAVTFAYQAGGKPVLSDIHFQLAPGQMLALVGHTGSGKSSLISLLLGLYSPQQGRIWLDDASLQELDLGQVRQQIGLVQQDPFIFAGTLADNIRLGRELDEASVRQVLETVQLPALLQLPVDQCLALSLQEGGRNLSAGQRQLLSLARALAGQPRLLILDEATASVDAYTEQLLQQSLNRLRGQHTLIVIAHRLSTVVEADQILVLSQGRILEQGNHASLLAQEGHYAHLCRLQQQLQAHRSTV